MKQDEDLIKKQIPKELVDQSAHFGSCLLFTMIGTIPIIGPIFLVWLWATTREYYQHKKDYLKPYKNLSQINFLNLDMIWSWIGIVVGIVISGIIWYFILNGVLG